MAAWLGAALTGVGALGGLFGLGKQSSTSKVNNTTTTTPSYDPTNQAFRDKLISYYTNLLGDKGNFEQAYRTGGLKNIADTSARANLVN